MKINEGKIPNWKSSRLKLFDKVNLVSDDILPINKTKYKTTHALAIRSPSIGQFAISAVYQSKLPFSLHVPQSSWRPQSIHNMDKQICCPMFTPGRAFGQRFNEWNSPSCCLRSLIKWQNEFSLSYDGLHRKGNNLLTNVFKLARNEIIFEFNKVFVWNKCRHKFNFFLHKKNVLKFIKL